MSGQRETLTPENAHLYLAYLCFAPRNDHVMVADPGGSLPNWSVTAGDIRALLAERLKLLDVAREARLLVRKTCRFLTEEAGGLPFPDVLNDQLYLMQLKLDTLDGVERSFEEFYAEFIKRRVEVSA